MRRIRLDNLSGQLLSLTRARPAVSDLTRISQAGRISRVQARPWPQTRWQSSEAASETGNIESDEPPPPPEEEPPLPSPPPERALRSAKLAALHARLSLSSKIPLQTLARTLVDPSADFHSRFNNTNLAYVGASIIQYHTSEFLITRFPRLPMAILFAAMKGYSGVPSLHQIARAWGVEPAAAPGEEVDPGLLQFSPDKPTVLMNKWGYVRGESKEIMRYKWRRGMSSRIIYDDPFGDMVSKDPPPAESDGSLEVSGERNTKEMVVEDIIKNAHANFVRAVVGAVYLYSGRDAAKAFVKAHILSRQLDISNLFEFKNPVTELVRLCAREDFEAPVARLLSETGRLSRTPVFVVGIYSGRDKLGEGVGPSLDAARISAAINTLKSWYLYSPGNVPVPSDTFAEDAHPWKPAYVDIGEIVV
ncbi:54S ribosomal protein L3 [Durotheca rogersii]|uniref:54S ribosomal protein L3 n=1 Tax=Durotheca rogersii TaxID=419775 RepID=UPI00221F45FD|nr:54S ribosomal protein L3 [Durotheca rogersii]KAI5868495.1 54S ribosomal protein L3 [Durotheca rogersii]